MVFDELTPQAVALRNAVLALEKHEAGGDARTAQEASIAEAIYAHISKTTDDVAHNTIALKLHEFRRLRGIAVLWLDVACTLKESYKERYYTVNLPGCDELNERTLDAMAAYQAYAAELGIDAEFAKREVADEHHKHCPVCGKGYF